MICFRSIALLLMIFKPDRFTNACNNLTASRLVRRNFDCDICRFHYRTVQNLHQTLESPRSAPTIASKTSKKHRVRHLDSLNSTTIAWSIFRFISSIDRLHHPSLFFLLTCCRSKPSWDALSDVSVSSSSSSCHSTLAMIIIVSIVFRSEHY